MQRPLARLRTSASRPGCPMNASSIEGVASAALASAPTGRRSFPPPPAPARARPRPRTAVGACSKGARMRGDVARSRRNSMARMPCAIAGIVRLRQRVADARPNPRRLQARDREDDRVVVASVELREPRVHVAAQRPEVQVRITRAQLALAPEARGPHDRVRGQRRDDGIAVRDERVVGSPRARRRSRGRTPREAPSGRPSSSGPRCPRGPRASRIPGPSRKGPCRRPARAGGRAPCRLSWSCPRSPPRARDSARARRPRPSRSAPWRAGSRAWRCAPGQRGIHPRKGTKARAG